MNAILLIKLLGGPAVILLASMAGRRWGPGMAGLLGGMPLLAGCIIWALWLEYGRDYALDIAAAAPSGLWANSAFMLSMAYASRFLPWYGMLACGWAAYISIALLVAWSGYSHTLWMALSALCSLVAAIWIMPSPQAPPKIANLPRSELFARMLAAFILVAGLSLMARGLGPTLTGVLSGGPVAATVIPAFTLAGGDRNAVLLQLRGFLTGLVGFSICFLILTPFGGVIGAWAALPAGICAVIVAYGVSRFARWLMRNR